MDPLSTNDMVRIWETGQALSPLDRALNLLCVGGAGTNRRELARLAIGQRDGQLLDLFEQTFGSRLDCQGVCPGCRQSLEYSLSVDDLRMSAAVEPSAEGDIYRFVTDGTTIRFRLPNSEDLEAVAAAPAPGRRTVLLDRCIGDVMVDGEAISAGALPAATLEALAACMARCDPQADLLIDLQCPQCGHEWQVPFDVASFLWTRICGDVRRLLEQVHILATAYKWREADILAMSSTRREYYLGRVMP
jgi:hypothetical protein